MNTSSRPCEGANKDSTCETRGRPWRQNDELASESIRALQLIVAMRSGMQLRDEVVRGREEERKARKEWVLSAGGG